MKLPLIFLSLLQSFFFFEVFQIVLGFQQEIYLRKINLHHSLKFYMPQLVNLHSIVLILKIILTGSTDRGSTCFWSITGDNFMITFLFKRMKMLKYLHLAITNIFTFYIRYMIIFINKPYFNKSFNHLGENVCVYIVS